MKKALLVILIVLAFLFYWFEFRPSRIRSKCSEEILSSGLAITTNFERNELGGNMNLINKAEREKGDYWYKDCLRRNGIKE